MTPWEYVAAVGWCLAVIAIALLILALGCVDDLQRQLRYERALRTTARMRDVIRHPRSHRV